MSSSQAQKTLLVRPPSNHLSSGVVTHIQDERESISDSLALSQWHNYTSAFRKRGWKVKQVERQDDCPDGVFVEDALVYFSRPLPNDKAGKGLILLCHAGHLSRRPERKTVEKMVEKLRNDQEGFHNFDVGEIKSPGTLDGGDVLKIEKESIVYVGCGTRTNPEGIKQLRSLLSKRGYSVVAVPMTKALHLKSAVTALPCGTIIGHPSLIDNISIFPRFLPVPHPHGVAVVVLSETEVLMSSSSQESCQLIESLGYGVVRVEITEFEKLEGCVTCLSVRLRP